MCGPQSTSSSEKGAHVAEHFQQERKQLLAKDKIASDHENQDDGEEVPQHFAAGSSSNQPHIKQEGQHPTQGNQSVKIVNNPQKECYIDSMQGNSNSSLPGGQRSCSEASNYTPPQNDSQNNRATLNQDDDKILPDFVAEEQPHNQNTSQRDQISVNDDQRAGNELQESDQPQKEYHTTSEQHSSDQKPSDGCIVPKGRDPSENMEKWETGNQRESIIGDKHLQLQKGSIQDDNTLQQELHDQPKEPSPSANILNQETFPADEQLQSSERDKKAGEKNATTLQSQIDQLFKENDDMKEQIEHLKQNLKDEGLQFETQLQQKDQENQILSLELKQKSEEIGKVQGQVTQLQEQVVQLQEQLRLKDGEILQKALSLKEKETQRLTEQTEKDQQLQSKNQEIAEKDLQLQSKYEELTDKDKQLVKKDEILYMRDKIIAKKEKHISQKDQKLFQKDNEIQNIKSEHDQQLTKLDEEYNKLGQLLKEREYEIEKLKDEKVVQLEEKELVNQKLLQKSHQMERVTIEKSLKEAEILELQQQIAQFQSQLDEKNAQRKEEKSLSLRHIGQQKQERDKMFKECQQLRMEKHQQEKKLKQQEKDIRKLTSKKVIYNVYMRM